MDAAQLAAEAIRQPPDAASRSLLSNPACLPAEYRKQTHDSIAAQIEAAAKNGAAQKPDNKAGAAQAGGCAASPDVNTIAGLLLGSPEFQRR